MTKVKDPAKWVAAAEICEQFVRLMRSGECDQLCRMATHTGLMYGNISDSAKSGDNCSRVSNRVRFIREFRNAPEVQTDDWDALVSQRVNEKQAAAKRRMEKRLKAGQPPEPELRTIWRCPRCGSEQCAGAVPLRMMVVKAVSGG